MTKKNVEMSINYEYGFIRMRTQGYGKSLVAKMHSCLRKKVTFSDENPNWKKRF